MQDKDLSELTVDHLKGGRVNLAVPDIVVYMAPDGRCRILSSRFDNLDASVMSTADFMDYLRSLSYGSL